MTKKVLSVLMILILCFAVCSCGSDSEPEITAAPETTLSPDDPQPVVIDSVNVKELSEMGSLDEVLGRFKEIVKDAAPDAERYTCDENYDFVQSNSADTGDENLKIRFNATQSNFQIYTTFSVSLIVTGDVAGKEAAVIFTDGNNTVEAKAVNYGTEEEGEYYICCEMLDVENNDIESVCYDALVKLFESGDVISVTVEGENATNSGTLSEKAVEDFKVVNDIYAQNRAQYLK